MLERILKRISEESRNFRSRVNHSIPPHTPKKRHLRYPPDKVYREEMIDWRGYSRVLVGLTVFLGFIWGVCIAPFTTLRYSYFKGYERYPVEKIVSITRVATGLDYLPSSIGGYDLFYTDPQGVYRKKTYSARMGGGPKVMPASIPQDVKDKFKLLDKTGKSKQIVWILRDLPENSKGYADVLKWEEQGIAYFPTTRRYVEVHIPKNQEVEYEK